MFFLKKYYLVILLILFLFFSFFWLFGNKTEWGVNISQKSSDKNVKQTVSSFSECVTKGFPVLESYPRQCLDGEGNHFVEETISEEIVTSKSDKIVLVEPKVNQIVKSPVKLSGKARGTWFFEASFPVDVVDWDGKIIGSGVAQAKADWMTEEFVPFTADINFNFDPKSYSNKGTIILKRDNPSGLPENDDALEVPVILQ